MKSQSAAAPSAVTIEIVRGALRSVQGEMEALIERTAMSAFIREKKDFHAALFDSMGRLIAAKAMPTSSDLIVPILELYPVDSMRPGDLYWYNDCYASRGAVSHTPDQVIVAPVFYGSSVVGFAHAWAHFNDIGGMRAGSISPQCTEIFQEGTIVPPVRLARAGELNEDLLKLFVRNSRFPAMVRGDMRALIAAVHLGSRRLEELAARFGVESLQKVFEELIARTGRVLKGRLREVVPEGTYRFTDAIDSDGHGHGPIKIRWRLEVAPERITLDASESDDQVVGPVNYLMSRTSPAMLLGAYLLGDSRENSINAGAESLFDEVVVREGSILCPRPPAALGQRGVTLMRNISACLGLFAVATGGQAPASHSAYVIWHIRGTDLDNQPFLMSDGVAIGYGARPTGDGHDAIYLVAQENYPSEFIESTYPLRMRRYAIKTDAGGPGRWRGGCGVIREVEVLAEEAVVAVRLDGIANPPWGVYGGQCARPGRCTINPGRPDERLLDPLSDGNRVTRGDVLRIETGGGGGWGHPFDREPERVLADVLGGFVSRHSAESDYGVVLAADGCSVDTVATLAIRKCRPASMLFHRHQYVETLS